MKPGRITAAAFLLLSLQATASAQNPQPSPPQRPGLPPIARPEAPALIEPSRAKPDLVGLKACRDACAAELRRCQSARERNCTTASRTCESDCRKKFTVIQGPRRIPLERQ